MDLVINVSEKDFLSEQNVNLSYVLGKIYGEYESKLSQREFIIFNNTYKHGKLINRLEDIIQDKTELDIKDVEEEQIIEMYKNGDFDMFLAEIDKVIGNIMSQEKAISTVNDGINQKDIHPNRILITDIEDTGDFIEFTLFLQASQKIRRLFESELSDERHNLTLSLEKDDYINKGSVMAMLKNGFNAVEVKK